MKVFGKALEETFKCYNARWNLKHMQILLKTGRAYETSLSELYILPWLLKSGMNGRIHPQFHSRLACL